MDDAAFALDLIKHIRSEIEAAGFETDDHPFDVNTYNETAFDIYVEGIKAATVFYNDWEFIQEGEQGLFLEIDRDFIRSRHDVSQYKIDLGDPNFISSILGRVKGFIPKPIEDDDEEPPPPLEDDSDDYRELP